MFIKWHVEAAAGLTFVLTLKGQRLRNRMTAVMFSELLFMDTCLTVMPAVFMENFFSFVFVTKIN